MLILRKDGESCTPGWFNERSPHTHSPQNIIEWMAPPSLPIYYVNKYKRSDSPYWPNNSLKWPRRLLVIPLIENHLCCILQTETAIYWKRFLLWSLDCFQLLTSDVQPPVEKTNTHILVMNN